MKPSASHLRRLFFPCVLLKANSHVGTKVLNMRHQASKGFCGILVGIPQHQKGYVMYAPVTRKIISSYDVVCGNFFLIRWQPYVEAMDMRPAVLYTPYAKYSRV